MSAVIIFPKFGRPQESTAPILPEPLVPSLATMTITLQRNHLHALTFRERFDLFSASMHLMMGDDEGEHIKHMERVHRIWVRVMGSEPDGAA